MILGIALAVCSNIMSKFINIRKLIFVEYYPMYSKNICDSYGENHGFQTSVLLFCTVGLDSLLRFYLHGAQIKNAKCLKHYQNFNTETIETCNTAMERKFYDLLGDIFKNCENLPY